MAYFLDAGHSVVMWELMGEIVRDGRLTLKMHSTDFAYNNKSISYQSIYSHYQLWKLQPKTGGSALSTKREIHA